MPPFEEFERDCAHWNDAYLLEQFAQGPDAFADARFYEAIAKEVQRRGLTAPAPQPAPAVPPATGPYIARLWRGQVPLPVTYWLWGVGGNIVFSGIFILASSDHDAPLLSLVALSYWLFAVICIWRSAGQYSGDRLWPILARVSVTLGAIRTAAALLGIL